MISFGASDGKIYDNLFFPAASDVEELSGSVTDPALLPSSSSHNARLREVEELIRVMTKAFNDLGLEWSPLRSHLAAGWTNVFSRGAIKPPANARHPSSLKFMTSSRYCGTSLTCLASGPSASAALTSVDGTEEKRYERLPPLDESVAAHLCPPMAIRWKARASHPFKLCICTCWMLLLGGWTSDFGTSLYGCASGLPGQDAC